MSLRRREFLAGGVALGGAVLVLPGLAGNAAAAEDAAAPSPAHRSSDDELAFASASDLARALDRRELRAVELTQRLLGRIERLDRRGPMLGAMIELNPDALLIAAERDAERAAGRVRGPLHGIPIVVKDNIDTRDKMATSAGSLLLADAALLLGPLSGVDPRDAATKSGAGKGQRDYTRFLRPGGLAQARIGVARELAHFHAAVDRGLDAAVAALKSAGAVVIDELPLPTAGQFDDAEMDVLLYEFKADLAAYLSALGPSAPARTLADVIRFNERERAREQPWFEQELFHRAEAKGTLADAAYHAARERCLRLTRAEGLDPLFDKHRLDAVICPSNAPAWVVDLVSGDHYIGGNTSFAAVSGYPSLTVPMGFVHSLPLGLSFIGRPWSEGRLIELGFAFETLTQARRPPGFLPTLIA